MQRFKWLGRTYYFLFLFLVLIVSCKPKKFIYKSPPHYDFSKPVPFKLDLRLREISGIIWDNHKDQFIAHNDEKGSVFFLDRGAGTISGEPYVFNSAKGDYEDIAIIGA